MDKITLRIYCEEKMTCVTIENPMMIPKEGDLIHVENVEIFEPMCAEKPEFKVQVLYKVLKAPFNIWYDLKNKTLTVDVMAKHINEVSKSAIESRQAKRKAQGKKKP